MARQRSAVQVTIFCVTLCTLCIKGIAFGQTFPADSPRREKARDYMKKAQEHLSVPSHSTLGDMARADLCRAQAELGDIPAAKETAAAISFMKTEALTDVARIEARHGGKKDAIVLLHLVTAGLGAAPETDDLATIGQAEADLGDAEGAGQIAAKLNGMWQQAQILCAIGATQANDGDLAGAKLKFAAAKASLKGSTNRFPWFRPWDLMLRQFAIGDVVGARETADGIASPAERATAYAMLGREFSKKGERKAGRELLDLSRVGAAQAIGKEKFRTLLAAASGFAELGERAVAAQLLADAMKEATAIDEQSETRPESMTSVSLSQRATGDVAGAVTTMQAALAAVEKIKNSGNQVHARWIIAMSRASSGDIAGAQESVHAALNGRMDPAETAMLASRVANCLARVQHEKADLSWIEALETAEEKGLAYAGAASGMAAGN